MRMFFKIMGSLMVAGGICMGLWYAGLLQFNCQPDKEAISNNANQETYTAASGQPDTLQEQPSDQLMQAVTKLPETLTKPTENISALKQSESDSVAAATTENAGSLPGKTDIPEALKTSISSDLPVIEKQVSDDVPAKDAYVSIDDRVYEHALAYLQFLAKDPAGHTEYRLSQFLKTEFDLSDKQVDLMLQTAFWKNFLVFQKKWESGETEAMQKAFDRELALKKAGFKACGIHLMKAEINAARTQLALLMKQLEQPPEKQAASMGESP